jgi:RNA polymerase sigma-70 factor (ECF subfamily)
MSGETKAVTMPQMDKEPADAVLIARFLRGDERAFEALYDRYRRQLYAFLNNLIGSGAECDDVFEETWLKVIDQLPGYRDDGRFGAWLFRVGRNLFYDRLRRTRQERENLSLDVEEPPPIAAPAGSGPGERTELSEIEKLIGSAVSKLPPELRETFLLRQQGVAFKEIAEIQQCSINTALSRMQYALRALRKSLSAIDRGVLSVKN